MYGHLRGLAIASAAMLVGMSSLSGEVGPWDLASLARRAVQEEEAFWKRIASDEPPGTMGTRQLFRYALALCEAGQHPERLMRLLELATRAQDRDPASPGFGNFKWSWRDAGVTDRNAVEFCMQDALQIWIRHRERMPGEARCLLRELLCHSIEGCLRHQVPPSYTNIAILNAGNLLVLGESFARPDVAAAGQCRLDAICVWTWEFGTHEYCSPTYYGTDLEGLLFLERHAGTEQARRQARALLELLWTDIAVNWFPPAQRLAGPHSRSYDYVRGLGSVDRHLQRQGWWEGEWPSSTSGLIPLLLGRWEPPRRLRELCDRTPRLVRQSWGMRREESRTHVVYPDVTLGCSGALYGRHDMPLTVDLPGDRRSARCYFIPDGREDPYGKKKYETGSARHLKALHLDPFWAGAQRDRDALGLVVYRAEDLQAANLINLQSHFVLRRSQVPPWISGKQVPLTPSPLGGGSRVAVPPGDACVLRYGSAAVGLRILWARAQDGGVAPAALVDDANDEGVLRLTVEHRGSDCTAEAAAAIWVRVGSGLADDVAFDKWRADFERARPAVVNVTDQGLQFEVPGGQGPVSIVAAPPYGRGPVELQPAPARAVLELDGIGVGRKLLEPLDAVRAFRHAMEATAAIDLPAGGHVAWEAEAGWVCPGMAVGSDPEASGQRYVWQPPELAWGKATGRAVWPLRVRAAGSYYLWGRVQAPDAKSDSFFVQIVAEGVEAGPLREWRPPRGPGWQWRCFSNDKTGRPAPLEFPAGPVRLQLLPRELGTKIDRLFLTADPREQPPDDATSHSGRPAAP